MEDEAGNIYNVEVQTGSQRNLPKRMRYYQSIIDLHILTPGADYRELKRSYVIFICGYDPFGRGKCVYRFENRCIDEPELSFGDETVKVVLNTKGSADGISETLRETIRYLDDGTVIEKQWLDRSRAESWTDEMKQQAAEHAKKRYQKCQKET